MFHFQKFKIDWLSVSLRVSSSANVLKTIDDLTLYFKNFSIFKVGRGLYGYETGLFFDNGLMVLFSSDVNHIYLSFPSSALSQIGFKNVLSFLKDYYYKVKRCDICVDTNKILFDDIMKKYLDGLYVSRFRSSSFVQSKKNKITSRTIYFGSRQSNSFLRVYEKSKEIFLKTGKRVPDFIRIEFEAKDEVAEKLFSLFLKKDVKALSAIFLNYLEFKENDGRSRIYNSKIWDAWLKLFGNIKKCINGSRILKSPDVMFWLKNQVSKSLFKVLQINPYYLNEILEEGRKKFEKERKNCLTFSFNPV